MSSFEIFALVAFFVFLSAGTYMCHLELRIQHLLDLLAVANTLPTNAHPANNTLGDFEALQGLLKTSQDDNCRLHTTIAALETRIKELEGLAGTSFDATERDLLRRLNTEGQQKVVELRSHLKRLQTALNEKNALLAAQDALLATADLDRVEMARLQRTISDQATTIWQRDVVVAKLNTIIEFIHRMTAAGGLQMVVTVLFVGLLAHFGGFDLGELGIDTQKFESYFEYARAMADGLPCPLLPQGGFRLNGIQFPLTGLRVVGTRIIEVGNTFLARGGRDRPAGQDDLPPMPHPPLGNELDKPPNAPSQAPPAAPPPTTTTTPAAAAPPPPAPASTTTAAPSQPAKAGTSNLAFQPSKKPGSFGVGK